MSDHDRYAEQRALDQAVIPALNQARQHLTSAIAADNLGDEQVGDQWLNAAYAALDHLDDDQLQYAVMVLLGRDAGDAAQRLLHVPDTPIRRHRAGLLLNGART